MSKKNQISFTKPAEPSFLKQFKQRAGYKAGPTVEDKKREMPQDDSNQEDKPEERPQIVTVKPGDLTAEEVSAIVSDSPSLMPDEVDLTTKVAPNSSEDSTTIVADPKEDGDSGGKVVFRKPEKRPLETKISPADPSKKAKQESVMERVRNKSLLSFDQGDDEE